MSLERFMPLGFILTAVNVACSPTSPPPLSQEFTQISPPTLALETPSPQDSAQVTTTPVIEAPEAIWGDDMSYKWLFTKEDDAKVASDVVAPTLRSNQTARARDRVGNLVFVEVFTSPPPTITDLNETRHYVGVILGERPRVVNLPDKVLFAHFAKNIRPNPDKIETGDRIRTALLLADSAYLVRGSEPTWTDEDGTLVIHYQKFVFSGDMNPNERFTCTLTADADQNFTVDCIDQCYRGRCR